MKPARLGLLFAACLAAEVAPVVVTRVLPMHDAAGTVGLAGVLAHVGRPEARTADFYDVRIRPTTQSLTFGWGWLAAKLGVPMETAFAAFTALFCLAGPALALIVLLRAFGRPPVLALLALPVVYHHQIWYGFLASAAAVPGMLLALAFARRLTLAPTRGNHVGLAASLLYVGLAHPFPLALTLVIVAPVLVWPLPAQAGGSRLGAWARRLLCFVPALVPLAPALGGPLFAPGEGASAWLRLRRELRIQRPSLADDAQAFIEWLGNGYQSRLDELVPIAGLATLLLFLIVGIRDETGEARERSGLGLFSAGPPAPAAGRGGSVWLAWAALVLLCGYALLPNRVEWPAFWWGVRVRCALPLYLVAVAAIRPRAGGGGLGARWLAPAALAGVVFAGYVTYDFAVRWQGRVLAGFDRAIAAIPPGQSVLGLTVQDDRHYTRAHPFLAQHYVARKGGRATPFLRGYPGAYWVTLKGDPPLAPPWGDASAFVWPDHALGYDYFLVETPLDGPAPAPFSRAPAAAMELIADAGQWRVYRRAPPPLPAAAPAPAATAPLPVPPDLMENR